MSSATDSSDSERARNPGPPPPPPFGPPKPKKKKKKAVPPQDSINKIWSRFSAPKFSKATLILPFAIPSSSSAHSKISECPKSERSNPLVSEDFERAVEECRLRVKKLIKECKRVNMRYRDPDFDIDWDLKWEKGYCLNGLAARKFELNGRAFANPTSNVPKAVKRVHEIFEKPVFLKDKVSPADVKQGSLGDCWLMASLTALANMDIGIQRICVEYDTKIGIYGFVFHRDGEWIISIIDDKLYLKSPDWDSPSVQRHLLEQTDREDVETTYRKTYQTGSQALFFAQCKDQNATWLPLVEKAYAKAHGDYASLGGGWIGEGVEDLTGGVTTELLTSDILDTDEFWENEILKVNKEFLFGCSTGLLDGGYGNRDGISEGHAYVLMEARVLKSGQRLVKLRNPWGKGKKGNWEGPYSDGSKEFTPEVQQELNHKFGNDSVFWISYQDLLRKYQHFDRTRLFQDSPDWRLTKKWISMEVPWKSEFEQKFRLTLKKESPVVLVLSQLDDRYFDGLQGQYSFRLQFRLHEVDAPEEDDYIVRSHGNYLMERSVVTELKSLPAGTYSVFIMVVAERNNHRASVEDVIKAQTKRREDNDKLAQVGVAYDFAHSKATVYMESKTAARKAQDKAKARATRIATRKKNWELRHLQKEIMRKQGEKNREKREAKQAKEEVEAKEKEDKQPKDSGVQTDDIKEVKFDKEDKAIQTEDRAASSAESEKTIILAPVETENENDKAVQTDFMAASFTESHGTPETPKSSSIAHSPRPVLSRISTMQQHGGPPPLLVRPRSRERKSSIPRGDQRNYSPQGPSQRQQYIDTDGESSASPISDFDDMYSDDDPTLGPRPVKERPREGKRPKGDSEDEDEPDPWNAVCIVGFRVYSQDEELEVKIFEGEEDRKPESTEPLKVDEGAEADVDDDEEDIKKEEIVESKEKEATPPVEVKETAEDAKGGEIKGENEPPKVEEAKPPSKSGADEEPKSVVEEEKKHSPEAEETPKKEEESI